MCQDVPVKGCENSGPPQLAKERGRQVTPRKAILVKGQQAPSAGFGLWHTTLNAASEQRGPPEEPNKSFGSIVHLGCH